MGERKYRFCFTQFKLDYNYEKLGNCRYLIVGDETCPTTGRKHHQGYVEFHTARTKRSVSKRLDNAHVKICDGDAQQNIIYCSKEKVIIECGTPGEQGRRTDLESVVEEIRVNPNISTRELIEMNPGQWCRNYRALEIVKSTYEEKRNWVTEVIYIYGPSGCGKTRTAIDAGATKVYFRGGFFDGYMGEDMVLFDDVDRWTFFKNRQVLLELLDRYPYNINIKGGSRNWKPRTIFITSNYPPEETFGEEGVLDAAIGRRLTEIRNLFDTEVLT